MPYKDGSGKWEFRGSGRWLVGGENGLFRRNRREGGFTLFDRLRPAGRASCSEGGHFVPGIPFLGAPASWPSRWSGFNSLFRLSTGGLLGKDQALRLREWEAFCGGGELAGEWVSGKDRDGVGDLVGHQKPAAGGIERKVARDLAAAGSSADDGEPAVFGRDREGDDDVVKAVGYVGEAGVAVEDDVAAGGFALEAFGLERDLLDGFEGAVFFVPAEDFDGR